MFNVRNNFKTKKYQHFDNAMKNILMKTRIFYVATLWVALMFVSLQVSSRTVTFTGAASGWATQTNVTFDGSNASSSSQTISCVNSTKKLSYFSLNGATAYLTFTLSDPTEKITAMNIVWMSSNSNQVAPIVFGKTVSFDSNTSLVTATNGGFAATAAIAASGGTNCPGEDITFPSDAVVQSILIPRLIWNSSASANVALTTYPSFITRLNNSSKDVYTVGYGAKSNNYIAQVILTISSIGATIDSFAIDGTYKGSIDQTNKAITVTLPYAYYNAHITSLTPSFAYSGTFVTVNPTNPTDFTNPVSYTLKNAGGDQVTYKVNVTRANPDSACNILTFSIPNQVGTTTFVPKTTAGTLDSILITMPYTSNQSNLAPTYTTSPLASSSTPASGVAQDFTSPVVYTVVSQGAAATKNYVVKVKKAAPDSVCTIKTFSFASNERVTINNDLNKITVIVPASSVLTSVTPTYTLTSSLSSITSPSFPADFSNPVPVTVTAESGKTKIYTVTVVKDGAAPVLSSVTPLTNVSLAGAFTLTYTDNYSTTLTLVDASKVTLSGGTLVAVSVSGLASTIRFKGLSSQTTYTLKIAAGAFADAFGNATTSDTTITFTTANGVNQKLPYYTHMTGATFELPAFINDPTTYSATADTKATVTTQYGAYRIKPGDTLTITTQGIGSIYANVYSKGGGSDSILNASATRKWKYSAAGHVYFSISNNVNTTVTSDSITHYMNRGTSISQKIDATGLTKIYIINDPKSACDIYIPFIYLSKVDSATETEQKVWCTSYNNEVKSIYDIYLPSVYLSEVTGVIETEQKVLPTSYTDAKWACSIYMPVPYLSEVGVDTKKQNKKFGV